MAARPIMNKYLDWVEPGIIFGGWRGDEFFLGKFFDMYPRPIFVPSCSQILTLAILQTLMKDTWQSFR